MKKEYMKPTQCVLQLQHSTMILAGSLKTLKEVNSGDANITIDTESEPAGEGFWGQ